MPDVDDPGPDRHAVGMPRALWNGAISFGLVNIPVKLFPAVSSKTVRFNQIDRVTGTRVRMKRVAEGDDGEREVPHTEIVKGYEVSPGSWVTIESAELEALDPKASRSVDISAFVDLDQIDPVFFANAYQVAPAPGAAKAYMLLVEAMEEANKVGIARFVMRSKQYLAAIRPKDGRLLMSTMYYADEIVEPVLPEYHELDGVEVTDKEREMAAQLIANLATDFEAEEHTDTYREKVLELIDEKAAGRTIVRADTPEETSVVDLMAALEASVAEAKAARAESRKSA